MARHTSDLLALTVRFIDGIVIFRSVQWLYSPHVLQTDIKIMLLELYLKHRKVHVSQDIECLKFSTEYSVVYHIDVRCWMLEDI